MEVPGLGHRDGGLGHDDRRPEVHVRRAQFDSPYADPCIAKFTGQQRRRHLQRGHRPPRSPSPNALFPTTSNSEELAAEAKAAGAALPQVTDQVEQVFLNYFNKVYDLYGRQVVIKR